MKVLAIDPGYDRVGIAILTKDPATQRETCLFSTCITTDKSATHAERLFAVGDAIRAIIRTHEPTHCAIEKLFFSNNQKTAMVVAEARGIMIYLARVHSLELHEYTPQEVKVAMTGYGKSDKHAVIDMVRRLVLNAPEKALDDEYDAIAIGVTCLAHLRLA
jgi:crossover junction endodeoxyribonuclease RuvC